MSDEKKKRDELSSAKNEDRTLPHEVVPTDESTRQSVAPFAEDAPTKIKSAPEISPTNLFDVETEPIKISTDSETEAAESVPDENALRPSKLRFALVSLFFLLVAISLVPGFGLLMGKGGGEDGWRPVFRNGHVMVSGIFLPRTAEKLQKGDEILSVNGQSVADKSRLDIMRMLDFAPGETQIYQIKRQGEEQPREVEFTTLPGSTLGLLPFLLSRTFLPVVFFVVAFLVFLLKPNDKQTLLLATAFALLGKADSPTWAASEIPDFFYYAEAVVFLFSALGFPLLLHLCLIFPEKSPMLRRFPGIKYLIYLPYLLLILPSYLLLELSHYAFRQFDFYNYLSVFSYFPVHLLYLIAILLTLVLTYRRTSETSKRRIRIVVAGFACAIIPTLITGFIISPLMNFYNYRGFFYYFADLFIYPFVVLMPITFAYAIVRHKVIPVSFVVRRGLQYLLAKNALRVLVALPILGVVWNIATNPNRTLSEILLNNSFAFYLFIALAVGFFLLMRSRISVWIDRRFFREQYNQEKLLRELIDDVKQSDSMPKMSRLVSSRIQSAIHPQSVYLFYEDARQGASDFSTGYTTSDDSDNLKLAADSPLLRFMQKQRGAIDFPFAGDGDLPPRETAWLRSIGANLLVPMHGTDGKLAGFFSLGEKLSEIPYTGRDKELLETLANQIALVNENLILKDRVRREQRIKTEVLSRFDEGNINLLKECPTCGKCFDRNTEKCDEDGAELTFSLPVERTIENRYRLEKLLGKGGMGAVYEATDLRINRAVAVKILSGAMFGNRDALRRFEREAQTAGKLNHRNIITVFDYGVLSTEGAFLVMELVRGETLSEVLKRKGRLDAETVVAWFGQVLDGVEAAHKAGIVHRDLKPDNIFVTRCSEDESVRLCILDFGLARFNEHEFADSVTIPGTVMGTLGYMPPEQLRGENVDERSDLFAMGVIIYEALRGEKPFAGKTYQEIMQSMSKEIIFDGREIFAKFFERSLEQNPVKRFASASEMKKNLLNQVFL
ncbi:MAG: protein kinase [Acidobacteriota bacterium]|nr:protein kinase [Acidobacteriota bacterium]